MLLPTALVCLKQQQASKMLVRVWAGKQSGAVTAGHGAVQRGGVPPSEGGRGLAAPASSPAALQRTDSQERVLTALLITLTPSSSSLWMQTA